MTLTSVSLASETKTQTTTRGLYAASDAVSPASPRIFAPSDHHHRPLTLRNSPPLDQLDVSFAVQRARSEATAGDQAILEDAALGGLFTESLAGFSACPRCEGVRAKGLNEWMDHLGECHPVPSRWPSSKVDRLVAGQDLHHPYTTVVDSHKKRRRNVTPRPLNSFMIFAQYVRRLTLYAFPDAPNVHISRRMGVLWRTLAPMDREAFSDEARRLQDLHALEFPDYKYRPRKRNRAVAKETPTEHLGPPSPPPPPPPPVQSDTTNSVESPLYPINSLLPGKLTDRKSIGLNEMASRLDASSPLMVQVPDQPIKTEPPSSLDVDTSSSTSLLSHCCSDGRSINWAGSVNQTALEIEQEEGEDWTLDPRTFCCPPEIWNHVFDRPAASPSRDERHPEAHLSYKPFSALSSPPYKRQLSPVDCSRSVPCHHHLKPEDNQVSPPPEPRFPLTALKSPSVELAMPPCYRDTSGETGWSLPTRSALSPPPDDPSCMQQLYAASLTAQRQHDEGDSTVGAETMRNFMASERMEPDFDSLAPDGIIDFIDYTKLHQLTSGLEDTNTAQPTGLKAGVETATAATAESPQESGEPTSPSSPPNRQNALPSIESWVRNANFSP